MSAAQETPATGALNFRTDLRTLFNDQHDSPRRLFTVGEQSDTVSDRVGAALATEIISLLSRVKHGGCTKIKKKKYHNEKRPSVLWPGSRKNIVQFGPGNGLLIKNNLVYQIIPNGIPRDRSFYIDIKNMYVLYSIFKHVLREQSQSTDRPTGRGPRTNTVLSTPGRHSFIAGPFAAVWISRNGARNKSNPKIGSYTVSREWRILDVRELMSMIPTLYKTRRW